MTVAKMHTRSDVSERLERDFGPLAGADRRIGTGDPVDRATEDGAESMFVWVECYPHNGFMGIEVAASPFPMEVTRATQRLGENIRSARVRRRMSQEELAGACGITRKTLYSLEKGAPGATIATAFTVLWKLGLLDTAAALADPDADEHGKILEAARRPKRVRHPVGSENDF